MRPGARGRDFVEAVAAGRINPVVETCKLVDGLDNEVFTVPDVVDGGQWYWVVGVCE